MGTVVKSSERIYTQSRQCLDRFRECLATRAALAGLQPHQERFWAWANQLKVFSQPHISLDAQLRNDKFERLRQAVYLILDVLLENLQLVLELSQDSTYRKSLCAIGPPEAPVASSPFNVPFSGIDGSLNRLERIALIIFQATENSLTRRILAYADQARNEEYEAMVETVLCYRFQEALPEELRQLVYTSILHRYYRIKYEQEHLRDVTPRWEPGNETIPEQPVAPQAPPSAPFRSSVVEESAERPPQHHDLRLDIISEPLTVDEDVVKEKLKEGLSAPPSHRPFDTASMSETGDAFYPNAPQISEGQSEAKCPICLKNYKAEVFQGLRWRMHVDADVLPYVCISGDCGSRLQFFANRRSWISHMRNTHTRFWIRNLANDRVWKCPLPHAEGEAYSSEEELITKHLFTDHPSLSKEVLQSIAHNSSVSQPRRLDVCPICGDEHRPQNRQADKTEDHDEEPESSTEVDRKEELDAKKMHSVSFVENSQTEQQTYNKVTESPATGFTGHSLPDTVAHNRMERYIGKHLKALAFFFLRDLIEIDEENQENQSTVRGRSMDDLDSVELDDLEDPAKLPDRLTLLRVHLLAETSPWFSSSKILDNLEPTVKPQPVTPYSLIMVNFVARAGCALTSNNAQGPFNRGMTIGELRARASDFLGVGESQNIRMVSERRLLREDTRNIEGYGLRYYEAIDVICDLGETPLTSSDLDEGFADMETISSNWEALQAGPDSSTAFITHDFDFWQGVPWSWSSDFDPDWFWPVERLHDINSKCPSHTLRKAVDVWRGLYPRIAYAIAANILLVLELYQKLGSDSVGGFEVELDYRCERIRNLLTWDGNGPPLDHVSGSAIPSEHARALKQCSDELIALRPDFWVTASTGDSEHRLRPKVESAIRRLRDTTLLHILLSILDTRNASYTSIFHFGKFVFSPDRGEKKIIRTFFEPPFVPGQSQVSITTLDNTVRIREAIEMFLLERPLFRWKCCSCGADNNSVTHDLSCPYCHNHWRGNCCMVSVSH